MKLAYTFQYYEKRFWKAISSRKLLFNILSLPDTRNSYNTQWVTLVLVWSLIYSFSIPSTSPVTRSALLLLAVVVWPLVLLVWSLVMLFRPFVCPFVAPVLLSIAVSITDHGYPILQVNMIFGTK